MLALNPSFKDLLNCFNSAGVRYLVLGGYAVNFHGYHRNTKDIDLWIAVAPENAKRVVDALMRFGFARESVPVDHFLVRGKVYTFGREPMRVDILTGPSGVEFDSAWAARVESVIDSVRIPFISLQDLKANKRASARPKDIADLDGLPPRSLIKRRKSGSRKRRDGGSARGSR